MGARMIWLGLAALAAGAAAPEGFRDDFASGFAARPEGWGHGPIPDDGTMHVNGTWQTVYCKDASPAGLIAQANTRRLAGPPPALALTVHAGLCEAAEIASDLGWTFDGGQDFPDGRKGYGYGYYETVMKTAGPGGDGEHGTVNAFFIRGAAGSGAVLHNPEVDFEFLSDEDWNSAGSREGRVHLSVTGLSGDSISKSWKLPFNPSAGFHTYGFLWRPGHATFFADGAELTEYALDDLTDGGNGVIVMANVWTGTHDWGGLPPRADETALYRSIRYDASGRTAPAAR